MRAYLRVFYCAILICAISFASYLYNRTRKTEVVSTILSSTNFTFKDDNNKINFYFVTPQTIESAYKKLKSDDIKILSSIIQDEKQDWGPINYKIINLTNAITGSSDNFLARLNDSAKFAVYYSSIMILKKFDQEGFNGLIELHFQSQNASARVAISEIIQNKLTSNFAKKTFKDRFFQELEKSEKFINDFHAKYCKNLYEECVVPSLQDWYVKGKPNSSEIQKRVLEFRRYRNSSEVQNFENARYFLPIFPELKDRLCKNQQANRLRGKYYKKQWESECIHNNFHTDEIRKTVKSNLIH